ncbi:hypothetical protein NC652_023530 [Populus alba x Populus x berolinensis]|nr:hypothetical protein NC652_023530 [Populus alba x Populus x berolinensis]
MPFNFNCHYQAAPPWLDNFFSIEMACSSFLLDPQQIHLTPPTNITTAIATSKEKSLMSLKPPTQSPVSLASSGYLKDLPDLKLEMELKGYNSEDPLFQESSVKSESRGGEIEMDKEKRRVTRREKDMSRARIALFTLKNKERKGP